MKVWTDGRDYVFARHLERIPRIMDRHYGVTGHQLRGQWRELSGPDPVVVVESSSRVTITVTVQFVLANLEQEAWLGTTTLGVFRRAATTKPSGACHTSRQTFPSRPCEFAFSEAFGQAIPAAE